MRLYPLAVAVALLPQITINACYLWAASLGHVDWCIPYIHSCTSISATGRQLPENLLFTGLMIPSAVMLGAYWWGNVHWLRSLGCQRRRTLRLLLIMGVAGACALILYCVALGHIGSLYHLQRRIGVTTFFGTSFLGQLLLIYLLQHCSKLSAAARSSLALLQRSAVLILLVGLASVTIAAISDDYYHRTDDAFEWTFGLLLCLHFLITAKLWWQTNFRLSFRSAR